MNSEERELEILQHSLGLDEFGRGEEYRNRVCLGSRRKRTLWSAVRLTDRGLMSDTGPVPMFGGSHCFFVTDAGRSFVREHSPEPPKLTRGQQRYLSYLHADSGLSFGAWLRSRTRRTAIGGEG